ncbi:recombinase family protein [Oerskovia jenensis]|uniref:recombinase family protein n=1 Tax=Oerskovia jenensis TaxID=162169 RepID=UPI0036DA932E
MTHLSVVPETATRAVLYLRQSTYREESISLEVQESAGREYCERKGYVVVGVEADPGITGRTWRRRPAVQRVMAMVEDGAADVIVLWKWSRLSRMRRDWAVASDQVDVAGGRIESATEPIDVGTSAGRFARGVMTELAAFESERIGDGWKEAHARRVAAGLPANGKARWGYLYDTDAKIHVPDPDVGPVVTETYQRYVSGESIYSLVRWLNANGYRTAPGYSAAGPGLWSDRSLRRALDSGFAAGLITVRGERLPGGHEPLISEATWEGYNVARADRRVTRGSERSQYLLSGLVRCACGSSMNGGQFGNAREAKFRCKSGKERGTHDGGYIMMRVLEDGVKAWLADVADQIDHAVPATEAPTPARDAKRIAREIALIEEKLVRATRQHIDGVIPEAPYITLRDELTQQRQALEAHLLAARVAERRAPMDASARALLDDWDLLAVEQRRAGLRELIARIVVTPGRPRGTFEIVPTWAR